MIRTPTETIWEYQPPSPSALQRLQNQLGSSPLLCELLLRRGIQDYDQAYRFFRPSIDDLHDPSLMLGMERSLERITEAILAEEPILLFGDYDVDGTMGVSLMYNFFKRRYPDIHYYIPDRRSEGYGLSKQGIAEAENLGAGLLISIDCGIKDVDLVAFAKNKNIDTIIIDHHLPGDELPEAYSILNPKQANCPYPYKELSGAGIAFKLISAWSRQECGTLEYALPYLDLAAISTAADVVPLQGENRTLLKLGIDEINKDRNTVLHHLKNAAGLNSKAIDSLDIGFVIGPRINAIGRLAEAQKVVDLFTSEDLDFIQTSCEIMNKTNADRRELDREISDEILLRLEKEEDEPWVTMEYSEHWHKGVVGIVASRVMEYYYRPTLIGSMQGDRITFSARSVADFDILEALHPCSDLFISYGGHKFAAGLSILASKVGEFKSRLNGIVEEQMHGQRPIKKICVEAEIENWEFPIQKFYNSMAQMAPFGEANPVPVFMMKDVQISGLRLLKERHVSFLMGKNNKSLRAISFGKPEFHDLLNSDGRKDVCFEFVQNHFRGISSIEAKVLDVKLH